MVLLRVADAGKAQAEMKARGVLVKNVSAMHPLLANCLRLTVGTREENAQMLALKAAFDPGGQLNPGKVIPTLNRCAEYGKMLVRNGKMSHANLPRF